jgi:hypothetical protein
MRPLAGILHFAIAASLPLPSFRLSRALLRALLLEVSSLPLLLQFLHFVQAVRVFPRHRPYPDPRPGQELPDISHELANTGFAEQLFRVAQSHLPVQRQVDGPLGILLIVKIHELPEGQPTPCRLSPHILPGQLHEGQIQPRSLCHPAATST